MKLDRAVFFARWRREFGALRAPQVSAIEALLAALESDRHITDIRWAAYMLATVYHETAATMSPIDEFGSTAYFEQRYGSHTAVGRNLGNTQPGDGARFHGRGYVQLTGRRNYTVMSQRLLDSYGVSVDLATEPERAKDILTAYRVMSLGMRDGSFTGKSLRQYITGRRCDYVNARRIINGLDRAALVARHAEAFERILRAAAAAGPQPATTDAATESTGTETTVTTATPVAGRVAPNGAAVATTGAAVAATAGATAVYATSTDGGGIPWPVLIVVGLVLVISGTLVTLWWLGRSGGGGDK